MKLDTTFAKRISVAGSAVALVCLVPLFQNCGSGMEVAKDATTSAATSLSSTASFANAVDANPVIGNIDGVGTDGVTGWACAQGLADSIVVNVYVGTTSGPVRYIGGLTASAPSGNPVATACGTHAHAYRFVVPFPTNFFNNDHPNSIIWVYGLSPNGGANSLITNSGLIDIFGNVVAPPVVTTNNTNTSTGMGGTSGYSGRGNGSASNGSGGSTSGGTAGNGGGVGGSAGSGTGGGAGNGGGVGGSAGTGTGGGGGGLGNDSSGGLGGHNGT